MIWSSFVTDLKKETCITGKYLANHDLQYCVGLILMLILTTIYLGKKEVMQFLCRIRCDLIESYCVSERDQLKEAVSRVFLNRTDPSNRTVNNSSAKVL